MEDGCGIMQKDICGQKMQSILDAIKELREDAKASELVVDERTKEIFCKIDRIWDVLDGGGRSGTGINPRLIAVEVKTDKNEKGIQRVESKLDDYIRERTAFERKLTWGIITAIGTACLGILTQFIGGKL